MIMIDNELVQ